MFDFNYNPDVYFSSQCPEVLKKRKIAWEYLREHGLPTKKNESWKYTDLSAWLKKLNFSFNPSEINQKVNVKNIDRYLLKDKIKIVFVDGVYSISLSDEINSLNIDGIEVNEINNVITSSYFDYSNQENHSRYLNDAFYTSGVSLSISESTQVKLQLVYVYTDRASANIKCVKNIINIESNANVEITESYISLTNNSLFNNIDNLINLSENSRLKWYLEVNSEHSNQVNVSRLDLNQYKDSSFEYFNLLFGGLLNRNEFDVKLNSDGSNAKIDGIYIAKDKMHLDNHIKVEHNASNTVSDVCFKGIAANKSNATFNAKAIVKEKINGIRALQSNKNILLHNTATINTKPELEIYSDDVICSHGATVGQIDENLIYYFQTRGIDYKTAVQMLTNAFLNEILDRQFLSDFEKEDIESKILTHAASTI